MVKSIYAIAYDIGTTGVKTCLFEISDKINLLAADSQGYNLYVVDGGGAEQHPDEWWEAMCQTTKNIMKKVKVKPEDISGISFCSPGSRVPAQRKISTGSVSPSYGLQRERVRDPSISVLPFCRFQTQKQLYSCRQKPRIPVR